MLPESRTGMEMLGVNCRGPRSIPPCASGSSHTKDTLLLGKRTGEIQKFRKESGNSPSHPFNRREGEFVYRTGVKTSGDLVACKRRAYFLYHLAFVSVK